MDPGPPGRDMSDIGRAPIGSSATDVPLAASFYEILQRRERGKLKVYIGSAAGTGKTYRMLQEAHELRKRGIDVVLGFIETHGRAETGAQLGDLEQLPRRRISYRGVTLEELDFHGVLARRPQVVIVDELAHTNVPGSAHRKRWQDVLALLDEGINVISAVNVQHLESLNDVLMRSLGIAVRETVPDWVVFGADQLINLDISTEDLRQRLLEGKIYQPDKVPTALANFFTDENLATLRELALREVASSVDRRREEIMRRDEGAHSERRTVDRILVAMSSRPELAHALVRKGSRIAGRLNSDWSCVWVETINETPDRIDATTQRKLSDAVVLAQTLGGEYVTVHGTDVAASLVDAAVMRGATLIVVGQSRRATWQRWWKGSVVDRLVRNTRGLDVLVVSLAEGSGTANRGGQ